MSDTPSNTQYAESMLTTLDNPFNPFTQFDDWNQFDVDQGYNTSSYLARITHSSDDLPDEEESLAISNAIKEILDLNVTGNYVAVTKDSWSDRTKEIV